MGTERPSKEDLKSWLESRFNEIDSRISSLELLLAENGQAPQVESPIRAGKLRPAWLNTIQSLAVRFHGEATAEQLADQMKVNKSVVSGYLARLVSRGIVERKYNHTKARGRYIFALTETGESLFIGLRQKRARAR